jgi:hypothetical protein
MQATLIYIGTYRLPSQVIVIIIKAASPLPKIICFENTLDLSKNEKRPFGFII